MGKKEYKETKICKKCGKIFKDFKSNKRKFCSSDCYYKYPKSEKTKEKLRQKRINKTYEEIYGERKAKEIKEKKREILKKWHKDNAGTERYKEIIEKIKEGNKGKILSLEHKRKLKSKAEMYWKNQENRKRQRIIMKGKHNSPKTQFKKGNVPHCKGKTKENYESLKKASEKMKKLWENPKYVRKMLKIFMKRPTSFEQKIILLCSKHRLPFIYTGDGRILIGRKTPDFVNKKDKIVIEVFLDYFKIRNYESIENYMEKRGKYFSNYGYKTIFIKEAEIQDKNWEEICLNKIKNNKLMKDIKKENKFLEDIR